MCGFVTILSGSFLLHNTKDGDGLFPLSEHWKQGSRIPGSTLATSLPMRSFKRLEEDGFDPEAIPLKRPDSSRTT
ncbi:hypothetical protein SLEP1_g34002 [Rubroshorea leprosula]|uniref:Uncharacterized protein n=2 Tax=Rubroshorea leprosula TaxID=152421 RepID=A0AAV5KIG2_9ROSI|nr:hypothetical protein SLEP1_g34002 [Rubroshorea leprosula]